MLEDLKGRKVEVRLINGNRESYPLYGIVKEVQGTLVHLNYVWMYNCGASKLDNMFVNTNALTFERIEVLVEWPSGMSNPWG